MNAEIILELLNYTSAYVVVLDIEMNIRFVNISLAKRLGYDDSTDLVGRCWLDFIPENIHNKIIAVHKNLLAKNPTECEEFINDIQDKDGKIYRIKWINTALNHTHNLTFSFGIPLSINLESVTEQDIRQQFHSVIEHDRRTIQAIKEFMIAESEKVCKPRTLLENENKR